MAVMCRKSNAPFLRFGVRPVSVQSGHFYTVIVTQSHRDCIAFVLEERCFPLSQTLFLSCFSVQMTDLGYWSSVVEETLTVSLHHVMPFQTGCSPLVKPYAKLNAFHDMLALFCTKNFLPCIRFLCEMAFCTVWNW